MGYYADKKSKRELLAGIEGIVSSRKLTGNSTASYVTADGVERIKYHDTVVLETAKNGTITLNSGGFRTVTTKARINKYQNVCRVDSHNGKWIVCPRGTWGGPNSIPFVDGMRIAKSGKVLGGRAARSKAARELKRIKAVKIKIAAYCKALATLLSEKGIPQPNGGDCWICKSAHGREPGSCIASHLDEGYIHGTLLHAALTFAGRNAAHWMRYGGHDLIVSSVRRYLKAGMGIA